METSIQENYTTLGLQNPKLILKLYTKNNCQPCTNIKAYLETRPDLQIEIINCNDNPERIADFYDQYKTFPCLQKEDGSFMAQSEKILEYFASIPGQMFKNSKDPEYEWGFYPEKKVL